MAEPSLATIKRLFAVSGNKCAFPRCVQSLIDANGTVTGEICHIKGRKPNSPRYDANQTEDERRAFENLILMCPIHHKVIDDDPDSYTVERLLEIKARHETQNMGGVEPNEDIAQRFLMKLVSNVASSGPVIFSQNQQGGITAQSVVINNISPFPQPSLRATEVYANKPSGGKFLTQIHLSLNTPFPVGNLYVGVRAKTVEEIELAPMRVGGAIYGHTGRRDGYAFTNLQNAYGDLQLDIISREPEQFHIEYEIN